MTLLCSIKDKGMHRLFTVHSEQLVGTHNGKNLCKYTQTIKSALVVKFTVLKKKRRWPNLKNLCLTNGSYISVKLIASGSKQYKTE